jgi:RNA polymerase sigma factor for flagellar operon FliA
LSDKSDTGHDPQRLLLDHLELIERIVAFTCRRHGLMGADTDDFSSVVKLKLVENDYAVLRSFQGRSSFSTFITVVVQRLFLDMRVSQWGKWRPSARARRAGDLAVAIERLLVRDGRSVDETLQFLAPSHPGLTRETIERVASDLPERAPRRRLVDIDDEVVEAQASPVRADDLLTSHEHDRASERISTAMRRLLALRSEEDRTILHLRFACEMTVAQIARALQIDQKLLYRRIERQMQELRRELAAESIDPDEALDLIGDRQAELDFWTENLPVRPSDAMDGATPAPEEISR